MSRANGYVNVALDMGLPVGTKHGTYGIWHTVATGATVFP